MKTRVALYARVSTSNGQQDPEMQLRELREYGKHRELTIVGEYIDKMTGSKDSRPALNRLMADASQRKFDAVLCGNWIVLADRSAIWSTPWQNLKPWG
jgi:DNA invertase Pin-like site-specific DNA recombinase